MALMGAARRCWWTRGLFEGVRGVRSLQACAAPSEVREALRTVSSCALRWADPYLWIRIVEACDVKLSADMIWKLRFKEAIDAFGLDTVAHFMERALDNQPNIEQKRAFVETLNMSVRIT
ncbi:hypothetical protein C8Q70DRAFT_995532 [Cubamyces menziesii]|nr:hypothetical protein C8Q70DRAFT_995532 [Cubamyces menziesii]